MDMVSTNGQMEINTKVIGWQVSSMVKEQTPLQTKTSTQANIKTEGLTEWDNINGGTELYM
jgi:hypothetical protein